MRHGRYLISDAHMRAMIVIEMNVSADDIAGMFNVIEMPLAVDTFNLYNTVGPLGYGVVRRVIVLGHADGDVMSLQHGHIIITAILHVSPIESKDGKIKIEVLETRMKVIPENG